MGIRLPAHEVAHAAKRAFERYGILLTWDCLDALAKRCQCGEGQSETRPDGSRYHAVVFGNRVLWCVYQPPHVDHPFGVIKTVMPSSVGSSRSKRDFLHMLDRKGEKKRSRPFGAGRIR